MLSAGAREQEEEAPEALGVRRGKGGEEVEGKRWDTEMGTGAEGEDRGKGGKDGRQRKGKTEKVKKKLWTKWGWCPGGERKSGDSGQRGRSQIW